MSESERKEVSRRTYLKVAGGTVAGLIVGGALGYVAKPAEVITNTVTQTVTGVVTESITETQTIAPKVLKVGMVGPFTGDYANIGLPIRESILVAVKELNDGGGIKSGPDKGAKIEMVFEDDQFKAELGVRSVEKLIQVDGVKAIIGIAGSGQAIPYSPIAIKNKVIMIACNPTNPKLSEAQYHPGFFRLTQPDQYFGPQQAKMQVKYLFKDQGGRYPLVWTDDEAGRAVVPIIKEETLKQGGEVIYDISMKWPTSDMRPEILKLKANNPENLSYVLMMQSAQCLVWAKQSYELGYGPDVALPVYSGLDVTSTRENKQYLEGALMGPTASADKTTAEYKRFLTDYQAMWGKPEPENFLGFMGYDNVLALVKAIEKGGYNWEGMTAALEGMEFQGARQYYKIRNGELDAQFYSYVKVVNGEFQDYMFVRPEELEKL